jgi:chromosome segregation ATPase
MSSIKIIVEKHPDGYVADLLGHKGAQAEQKAAGDAVVSAQANESELVAQLATDEAALAANRTAFTTQSSRASSVREEIASVTGEVERLRSFLQQSESTLSDLQGRIDSAHAQAGEIEIEAAEQQAQLDQKTAALEIAREERNRLREIADHLEHERMEKSDEVRGHEKALADARETLMRTIAKLAEARNQVQQIALDDARVGHRGSPRLLLEPALRRGVRARNDFDPHVTARRVTRAR